jgi:hypothetical protein
MVRTVVEERQSWRGELPLDAGGGSSVPLAIRADVIARPDGSGILGYIVLVTNMSEDREAQEARGRLERAIRAAQRPLAQAEQTADGVEFEKLLKAVLANASMAVIEVGEESVGPAVVPSLDGLEASTKRAAELALQMITYAAGGGSEL